MNDPELLLSRVEQKVDVAFRGAKTKFRRDAFRGRGAPECNASSLPKISAFETASHGNCSAGDSCPLVHQFTTRSGCSAGCAGNRPTARLVFRCKP